MEEVGTVTGGSGVEAVGIYYGAVCVEVVASPSWVGYDCVAGDEGCEEREGEEEGDCAER